MFGPVGLPELILIFAIIFLLFGPDKLPGFSRQLGKTIRLFRNSMEEAKRTIEEELKETAEINHLKKEIAGITDLKEDGSAANEEIDEHDQQQS